VDKLPTIKGLLAPRVQIRWQPCREQCFGEAVIAAKGLSTVAIYRVRTGFFGWPGAPGLMTHYFAGTQIIQQPFAVLASDRVKNALTNARPLYSATTNWLIEPLVDVIDEANGELLDTYTVNQTSVAGTGSNEQMPHATQLCISWKSDGIVNGRRVRGRTFLGPVAASANTAAGVPTAAALTALTAFGNAMEDAGTTFVRHVIWHRPTVGGTDGSHHDVIQHSQKPKWAVLRSRRD